MPVSDTTKKLLAKIAESALETAARAVAQKSVDAVEKWMVGRKPDSDHKAVEIDTFRS